jgi:hypothetical protein
MANCSNRAVAAAETDDRLLTAGAWFKISDGDWRRALFFIVISRQEIIPQDQFEKRHFSTVDLGWQIVQPLHWLSRSWLS